MIKTYDEFITKLNKRTNNDDSFVYDLLTTVVKSPNRYTGIFRLSNAKTKLIQNVTQSREIKFGDFMEGIITEYLSDVGFTNLNKNIGTDELGNALSADQVFKNDTTVFLIEQKIRDDHDSTKKRGQYENFRKKYTLLKKKYPNKNISANMWFIDSSLTKNKNYYIAEAEAETINGVDINIYYGGIIFDELLEAPQIWEEVCAYLLRNKQERSNDILEIPDFDTSIEVRSAIQKLRIDQPLLYRKLISNKPEYVQLRKELFPTGTNLE